MNITADVIHCLQRDLFNPPRYCFTTEIQTPGGDGKRFLDGMAIDIHKTPWETIGFEVKVSRGDWLNEVRSPEKSLPARSVVDRFYFVFGDASLYKEEEIPEGCGVIHIQEDQAIIHRQAGFPVTASVVATYDRPIIAAFLQRYSITRDDHSAFIHRIKMDSEAKGRRKAMNEARRRSTVTTRRPSNGPEKRKYDPGRYNLDDGQPLDLP